MLSRGKKELETLTHIFSGNIIWVVTTKLVVVADVAVVVDGTTVVVVWVSVVVDRSLVVGTLKEVD